MRFIAGYQHTRVGECLRWGVESICAVLTEHGCPIAPSTYYDARDRAPGARVQRDEELAEQIAPVHADNYGVYGARKVWLALNREGIVIARCTVEAVDALTLRLSPIALCTGARPTCSTAASPPP